MRSLILIFFLFGSATASAFVVDASSLGRSVTADGSSTYLEYYNNSDGGAAGDWEDGYGIQDCFNPFEFCFDAIAAGISSNLPASGEYEIYTVSFGLTTLKAEQTDSDNGHASLGLELTFDQAVRYDFTALCVEAARDHFVLENGAVAGSVSISGDFGSCDTSGSGILEAGTYQLFANSSGSAYADYSVKFSAVPIPAAAWLFGSALAGLGWMRRKQTV